MSERRFTLDQYEQTIENLLCRRLTPHDPVDAGARQPGIRVDYYEADAWPRDRNLASLPPVATTIQPQIDLAGRKRNHMFGFVFTGLFHAPADGVYTFEMRAESGSELRIAGEVVVDSQRVNSANSVTGAVALRQGWHPIRLRFLEYGHNDGLSLTWSGPSAKQKEIATDQLGHRVQQ
jgi:hexosaminidase